MECGTISELGSSLSTRFETAKTAFRLHVSAGRDAEELAEMMANLGEIQRGLKELRATADQEKHHLEYAKSALAALREERVRVVHLMANLPSRLPNMIAQQQQQQQQQQAAAATNGSRTASDSAQPATAAPSSAAGRTPAPSIAYLTVAEFDGVPQYMRGRGTRDQANKMLDELNSVISARYGLTRRPRTALSAPQRKLWIECKREENKQTKGRCFFTEEDFKRFNKSGLSKAMRQLLVLLRHVGRISSLREPGNVVRHVLV